MAYQSVIKGLLSKGRMEKEGVSPVIMMAANPG
jgi:hypothetical protein